MNSCKQGYVVMFVWVNGSFIHLLKNRWMQDCVKRTKINHDDGKLF